jgi:hypothetical protein
MADEVEQLDAVALLEAHLAGDERAIEALVSMVGVFPLFACTVGFVVELVGRAELARLLAAWRASHPT